MFRQFIAAASIAVAATLPAYGATTDPTHEIYFSGENDSADTNGALFTWVASLNLFEPGFTLSQLAKVDSPATTNGNLTVSYDGDANDPKSGSWSWTGLEPISLVVYKAANGFVAHIYDPAIFGNMWETGELGLVKADKKIKQKDKKEDPMAATSGATSATLIGPATAPGAAKSSKIKKKVPTPLVPVSTTMSSFISSAPVSSPGNGQGLSHISLYQITGTPVTHVPLPAGGILLITGMGAMVVASRRRRKSS